MSCWLLESEPVSRVACFIARMLWRKPTQATLGTPQSVMMFLDIPFEKEGTSEKEQAKNIAKKLHQLNKMAFKARYGDMNGNQPFTFKAVETDDLLQVLKSMDCLQYQCNEGNVHESDLYKNLEMAADNLAMSIARNLPEYAAAVWG